MSSAAMTYETSLCDAILRTFIGDLSPALNVSKIELQSTYDPRAKKIGTEINSLCFD